MSISIPRKEYKSLQSKSEIDRRHPIGSRVLLSSNDQVFEDKAATFGYSPEYGEHKIYGVNNSHSVTPNNIVSGSAKRSVFAILNRSLPATVDDGIFSLDNGAGGTAVGERWSFVITSNGLRVEIAGSGYTSNIAVASNRDVAVGLSFDGTNLGGHTLFRQYLDTGEYASASSAGTSAVNTALENIYTGSYYSTSADRCLNGALYDCWLMEGELYEDEFLSLAENPYQILKPRRKYWVLPTAAAPTGFQAAWAMASKRSGLIGAR